MKKHLVLCSVVATSLLAGVNVRAEGWKVGGFADANYQWTNTVNTGFRMGDAALRFAHEGKESSVVIDAAFDLNTSFAFANKGQAYVAHKYGNGFGWKLGMFDTPFGNESNYSDRNWAASGSVIAAGMLPTTFMGAQVSYTSGAMAFTLMGADPRGTRIMGAGANPDLALQAGYTAESFWVKAGFLYNTATTYGYLIDVLAGVKMGSFKADLGFDMANPAGVSKMGIYVNPVYAFSDKLDAGVRFEYYAPVSGTTVLSATAGPTFSMSKELKVRPQYTYMSTSGVTAHGAILSAVYSL